MEIVIDTNIIFNDWALRTDDSRAFLDFVEQTGSIIYIPRIVWEETRKNYAEDVKNKHDTYVKACKQFGKSLIVQPELKKFELDFNEIAENYLTWLSKELKFEGSSNVLPYGDFTERIALRVMARRKPFNLQNDNEYKDTLVWETILDIASGNLGRGDEEIVLISNDSNAFGVGKIQPKQQERGVKVEKQRGVLHVQLQEDIDAALEAGKSNNFYYYESFAEFLAAHYTHIKGINEKSVREYLEAQDSGFEQMLWQELKAKRGEIITAIQSMNSVSSLKVDIDKFKIQKISTIHDFYVYSFQKGEVVRASGNILVYLEAPVDYGYAYHRITSPAIIHPIIEIKFSLPYVDRKPSIVQFESVAVPVSAGLRLPERPKAIFEESIWQELIGKNRNSHRSFADIIQAMPRFENIGSSFWNDSIELVDLDTSQQFKWGEAREVKPTDLKQPASKFLPAKGAMVPFVKGKTTKKRKKGAKKR